MKLWNKIKRHISVIDAIKHDVATRLHFDDYEQFRKYNGRDKRLGMEAINNRIINYVKTGEFYIKTTNQ